MRLPGAGRTIVRIDPLGNLALTRCLEDHGCLDARNINFEAVASVQGGKFTLHMPAARPMQEEKALPG